MPLEMKRHHLYLRVEREGIPILTGLEFLYVNDDSIGEIVDTLSRFVDNYDPFLPLAPFVLDTPDEHGLNPRLDELCDVQAMQYLDTHSGVKIARSILPAGVVWNQREVLKDKEVLPVWTEFLQEVKNYQQYLQGKP